MRTLLAAACLAVFPLPSALAAGQTAFCSIDTPTAETKYHEIFQPICHNCYEIGIARAMGAATFQQVLDKVKNVEIDIYDQKDLVTGAVKGEWYVRHLPGALGQSGNDNNCTGNGSGTNNLSACLDDIRAFSDAHPGHEVITLYLDKKQGWSMASSQRRPRDLDALVTRRLGGKLYTPAQLKGNAPSVREAAQRTLWPRLQDLRGRVLIALTGDTGHLNEYVKDRGDSAALFVAPNTYFKSDITGRPGNENEKAVFSTQTAGYVVFYNIKNSGHRRQLGTTTRQHGYVARLYDGSGEPSCSIVADCINANALDHWDNSRCSDYERGYLHRRDIGEPGWLPQQAESRSLFSCPSGTLMSGRWHDCGNKGDKCDENGNSTVFCTAAPDGVSVVPLANWESGVTESNSDFVCPDNTALVGRRHDCRNKGDKCDENGTTQYHCAALQRGGQPIAIPAGDGPWSQGVSESSSRFVCPDGQVLNGRSHHGDENGSTSYHCVAIPPG